MPLYSRRSRAMACRRAGSPWWGTGRSRASPSSDSTCRVKRAQAAAGKRLASTWLLFRSSRQTGASGGASGAGGAGTAGRGRSTSATKKPRLGWVYT